MPTLYPPEYPPNPEAPLLAFGAAFAESIARSTLAAVSRPEEYYPHQANVRSAAALTMLEAFHPRDHLECMMAAQGVSLHHAMMNCLDQATLPDVKRAEVFKYHANAVQLARAFSTLLHDIERRQAKPLPPRPPEAPPASPTPPPPPADDERFETRPDGTPDTLTAYKKEPPEEAFIPREPPIMLALATRPKPYRIVNAQVPEPPAPPIMTEPREPAAPHAPRVGRDALVGDTLARLVSRRLDPDAPDAPLESEDDGALIELELLDTGGDPAIEAERRALMAEHPEGRPVSIIRYGRPIPLRDPPEPG